ncbi:MAG: alkaline phosphatase [Rhodobacteraceae bacterium]|nr:alkaline phosphatase [Paracoccaceae bacterium]MAY47383.1 alkaline phosphatase [Paracoccaceae bacterium]
MKKTLSLIAMLAGTTAMAQDLPQQSSAWYTDAQSILERHLARTPNTKKAKNIILMIADGNGVGTNYATRVYVGQKNGGMGEEYVLPYEQPDFYSALVKTYNINAQTPDSAPTAGSMNTGVKQRFNLINLGENAIHDDCTTEADNKLTLFSELMTDAGKSVGVVTTARLTHATPAAAYAKTANRNWEDAVPEGCDGSRDIATQLIDALESGTVDIAMGGGARYFVPKGAATPNGGSGHRPDDVDLLARAQEAGIQYAHDKDTLAALDKSKPILGMWTDSHASYAVDRPDSEPSLADMTKAAIEYLSQNEDGYYLEIEAGRVDHANHAGNAYRAVTDGEAWAEAVAMADQLTDDEDTLLIVTADHEHAIAFNGYCGRGSDILGLCMGVSQKGIENDGEPLTAADGKPYTVIGYLNGSGSVLKEQADGTFSGGRGDLTQDQVTDVDYVQEALIPMSSESHSGEDVAVFAKGPGAYLFDGVLEQNYIFHVMNHAANAE